MMTQIMYIKRTAIVIFCISALIQIQAQSGRFIDHNSTDLHHVPLNWIDSAKAKLDIGFFRASHGTQLTQGGMTAIRNFKTEYAAQYNFGEISQENSLHIVETLADLEHQNDTWVSMTEEFLDNNPECNVIMWAWCGIAGMDIDQYLSDMQDFEARYGPGGSENRPVPVTFVYMTSHVWPWADKGEEVWEANLQIRKFCYDNNKWLYDFHDLEAYNPDGEYFGDGNPDDTYHGTNRLRWDSSYDLEAGGRGNWGIEWMNENPGSEWTQMAADDICPSCEHSDGDGNDHNSRLQCILKGNAAWWLWASLAGWVPEPALTQLSDKTSLRQVVIHPNPADRYIILSIPETLRIQKVYLFDQEGQQITNDLSLTYKNEQKEDTDQVHIYLPPLQQGIYFAHIIGDKEYSCTKKVIIKQ